MCIPIIIKEYYQFVWSFFRLLKTYTFYSYTYMYYHVLHDHIRINDNIKSTLNCTDKFKYWTKCQFFWNCVFLYSKYMYCEFSMWQVCVSLDTSGRCNIVYNRGITKNVLVNILNLPTFKSYLPYRYKRKLHLENFNIWTIMKDLLFVPNYLKSYLIWNIYV